MEVEGVTAEQMKSGIQNINSAKNVEKQMGLRRQKQMAKEVAYLAYHSHWSRDEIYSLPHPERRLWVDEVAKMILGDVMEDLEDEGLDFKRDVPVGMMVEVPARLPTSTSRATIVPGKGARTSIVPAWTFDRRAAALADSSS